MLKGDTHVLGLVGEKRQQQSKGIPDFRQVNGVEQQGQHYYIPAEGIAILNALFQTLKYKRNLDCC